MRKNLSMETMMADTNGDQSKSKDRPGTPVELDKGAPGQGNRVTDPHPDTEEGYDKDRKVPMTGL